MDYYNSSLIGLPASTLGMIKFISHTAAAVIFLGGLCHYPTPNPPVVLYFILGKIKIPIMATKLHTIRVSTGSLVASPPPHSLLPSTSDALADAQIPEAHLDLRAFSPALPPPSLWPAFPLALALWWILSERPSLSTLHNTTPPSPPVPASFFLCGTHHHLTDMFAFLPLLPTGVFWEETRCLFIAFLCVPYARQCLPHNRVFKEYLPNKWKKII